MHRQPVQLTIKSRQPRTLPLALTVTSVLVPRLVLVGEEETGLGRVAVELAKGIHVRLLASQLLRGVIEGHPPVPEPHPRSEPCNHGHSQRSYHYMWGEVLPLG